MQGPCRDHAVTHAGRPGRAGACDVMLSHGCCRMLSHAEADVMPWAVAAGAGCCVASPCGEPPWDERAEAEAEAAPTRHTAMTDWRLHLHRAASVSTRAPHTRTRARQRD